MKIRREKSDDNCTAPQKLDTFGVFFMKYNYEIRLKAVKLVLEGGLSVRKPDVTWAVAARKFTCG